MKIIERAMNMLFRPKQEWPVVAAEPTTVGTLYRQWIAPLAAIQPVASVIGLTVVGISLPIVGTYRMPLGEALRNAIFSYVITLVAVYVLALLIDWLAPGFGGTQNRVQALKLTAFAFTPVWLAGVLALMPWSTVLTIGAVIYSLCLLYKGLPVLMQAPVARRRRYFATVLASAFCINLAVVVTLGLLAGGLFSGGGTSAAQSAPAIW